MRGLTDAELNSPRAWAIDMGMCAATGVVLGVIGPFGSFFNDTLVVRIAYWTAIFMISGVAFAFALRWSRPRAARLGLPLWVWTPALVVIVTVPLTGVTRLIAIALWPGIRHTVGWAEWYGQSFVVGMIYVGLYAIVRLVGPAPAPPVELEAPGEPEILRRIPPRLGQEVLCLQMEDHYVRIHTAQGSTLALMSMGQALEELGGVDGMQVHRSWWVARRAVASVVEDGRNLKLRLTNGVEAPVSRASVARLRAAGWLSIDSETRGRR